MPWANRFLAWAANYEIVRSRNLYGADKSPLHVWRAYRWAREAGRPIPEWVLDHFDEVAARLDRRELSSDSEVADAFGIVGRKKRNARVRSDQLAAVQCVWALQEKFPEMADKHIFAEVAEQRGVSADYVEKAYYVFRTKS
jgi:hypothetical protein